MIRRLLTALWHWATAPRFTADDGEHGLRRDYEAIDRDRATQLRGDGTAMREDR